MTLENGSLILQRYRIIEVLGQGGMGAIYRALDENLGVEVAIKENLFTTEDFARQFQREATILASLRHPNLPRVTDHFIIDGQGQYLVMDFIEGEDLHQRIEKQGTITETEAIQIGIAICDALIYLGERTNPIVHRDIKPGNIKITPSGEIYLVDFGLAKIVQADQLTTTAARAMTPGYSPPEQYGTARTDPRSDIYSLGATLYAAVSGKIPEDGLARLMGQLELTPLKKRNPRISDAFAKCIEKSLEVKPEDRYANANEFKNALLEIQNSAHSNRGVIDLSSDEKQTPSDDQGEQKDQSYPKKDLESVVIKPSEKNILPKVGIGLGLLLIMISVGWWAFSSLFNTPVKDAQIVQPSEPSAQYRSTQSANILAILPSATKTATPLNKQQKPTATRDILPTVSSTRPLLVQNPTATPMGGGVGQIAFASDMNGTTQIYLMNLDGKALFQVTDLAEGACQPDFSPDGTRIVFISPCMNNRELYPSAGMFIINVDGTNIVPLPSVPGGDFDPAWAPDGNSILFTSLRIVHRPRIYRMDLTTFEVHMLSEPYGVDYQAAWSADGKRIVYVSRKLGPTDIWVMNADGSESRRVTLSGSNIDSSPVWSVIGSNIVFTQVPLAGGIPRLASAAFVEGKVVESQFDFGPIPVREATFSPDGLWLIFESWPDGVNHDIYLSSANGAGRQQITSFPSNEFDAVWRPTP